LKKSLLSLLILVNKVTIFLQFHFEAVLIAACKISAHIQIVIFPPLLVLPFANIQKVKEAISSNRYFQTLWLYITQTKSNNHRQVFDFKFARMFVFQSMH